MKREAQIRERVSLLIRDFERYLTAFDQDPAFTRFGQLENHVATIRMRRGLGSASAAIQDATFLKSLYLTLEAWGIGQRGSKLVSVDQFARALTNCEMTIASLEREEIESPTLNVQKIMDKLWELISSLLIVENEATLVPCTKTLHHLLPELVVPMDRMFARTFFSWHVPEFQYDQEKIFRHAYENFVRIARATTPSRFVRDGWRTCTTKIIDNALIGFCRVENLPPPS